MEQTFMKEKPVLPLLLSMGIPMIISMMASSLYNIIDSIFVAKISESAMTALSLVFPMQNLINALGVGFGIGINALIAKSLGEEAPEKAGAAATQGLLLSIIHGIFLAITCLLLMLPFLHLFTTDEETLRFGLAYAHIIFLFSPVVTAGIAFEKIFQAVGRMMVSMSSMLFGCILNLILDPLLIFGIGPFPELGIRGAAIATGIGQIGSLLFYGVAYLIRPTVSHLSFRHMKPDFLLWIPMYSVGIAATLNLALPSLMIAALNAILAPFSQTYILVLGVYYKLQALLYQTANGLVQGMRPLIAYNYGAKEYKRVTALTRCAVFVIACMMLFGTILCLLIPEQLLSLFTGNAATIRVGTDALRIICCGFIISSLSVAVSGALEGLGMGFPSFQISLTRYLLLILPLALLLSHFLGAVGVWHAFWMTEAGAAAFSVFIYKKQAP